VVAWERRHNTLRLATLNGDVVAGASFEGSLPPFSALLVGLYKFNAVYP
jgi:hypothetical protein